jgi:phosphatidate cytidylyltransferase
MGFMLLGYGLMIWFCGDAYRISDYGIKQNGFLPLSLAGFILLVFGIFSSKQVKLKSFGAAALGLVYISLSWGLLIHLFSTTVSLGTTFYQFDFTGAAMPIIVIASIWINDTMAYIVGSFIGRRPLSPISPKKTWEGTIGGIILAVGIVGWLVPLFFMPKDMVSDLKVSIRLFAPVALIAAITGTLGDLLESKLKRMAGVKDSGSIMPGHGGFLDRFDSLLVAIPFVSLYVYFGLKFIFKQ